jgi:hypothetical protein
MFGGLPFPDNEFDFVHQDSMTFIIKTDQWNFIISEMIRYKTYMYFVICIYFIIVKKLIIYLFITE